MTIEQQVEAPVIAVPIGEAAAVEVPVDVAGLPDTALRSALEFAVRIAAAGQKLRPPVPFPSGLKPYLKLDRRDRESLRAMRRVIVGDDGFRDKIAARATDDLVDAIGVAWLQRAEGWQERVRALHLAARQAEEEAGIEAALRRAERRREAAEHVAARANAELIGHNDNLTREQVRREKAERAASSASADATSLRTEITGLRRDLDRVRQTIAAESHRADVAEATVIEVRVQLSAVEAMRDEILAQRASLSAAAAPIDDSDRATSPSGAQSNSVASRALQQAAGATRDLANALATAAEALATSSSSLAASLVATSPPNSSAPIRTTRSPRAPQRKPIAIPGGVYGDSFAAAIHVLRTTQAVVIVDGYNVAKLAWPSFELSDQREMCIDLLEDIARRNGTEIHVVFDGADVIGASARRRLIRVQFSPAGVSADDVIRAEVQALPASTPVVVVTNDQAIVTDVRSDGANVVSSDMLLTIGGRPLQR